ncbi:MAG TPA: phosphatase PAP2 family protein [bacterium]|nr:phosphatase PAP2 family protein [bacterium]
MEDLLYSADVAVFRWINRGWSCPFLDSFFSYITDYRHPLMLALIVVPVFYWLWKGGSQGRWLVLSLFAAVLISDQTASHAIKGLVERVRPCNALDGVLTPLGKSGAFSFPSSHAANMGSSMFLLSMAFPARRPLFLLIALLVGLSRVYLGLHYPSDVLSGYVLGVLCGWGVWWMVERIRKPVLETGEVKRGPLAAKKRRKTKKA